jgi:lauroyl/myristoyl acyltransferase
VFPSRSAGKWANTNNPDGRLRFTGNADGAGWLHKIEYQRRRENVDSVTDTPVEFARIEEIIADLRDGKMIILVDDEDRENEGDFVFRRTSTGEFLFRLTGEFPEIQFWFRESAREDGLRIRIFNVPNANTSTIGDATTLKWTLSFKEH